MDVTSGSIKLDFPASPYHWADAYRSVISSLINCCTKIHQWCKSVLNGMWTPLLCDDWMNFTIEMLVYLSMVWSDVNNKAIFGLIFSSRQIVHWWWHESALKEETHLRHIILYIQLNNHHVDLHSYCTFVLSLVGL